MAGKIFITLGSQKFQFNRLLKSIDDLYEKGSITEIAFAQTGYSDYTPVHYKYKNFLDRDEFSNEIDKADIIITHGGTGVIIGAVKRRKKVIVVPRLAQYGEHVDNHQLELIKEFNELDLICPCLDVQRIDTALEIVKKTEYKKYQSNTKAIITSVKNYLEKIKH